MKRELLRKQPNNAYGSFDNDSARATLVVALSMTGAKSIKPQ